MALSDQQITDALAPSVAALAAEHIARGQRIERAIDAAGNVIIDPPDFLRVKSPDGSIHRLKVSNTGVLTTAKE